MQQPERFQVTRTAQAIAVMDTAIRFMSDREYASPNPALGAVRGPLVVGGWVMLALAFVILVWGTLVPIESAAVARGSVVLLSSKKTIQHMEGGIIDELLVKDGDTVIAGQPLITLNNASAMANRDMLQSQLYAARAAEARLITERDGMDTITFPDDMIKNGESDENLAKTMAAQERLFASEQEAQKARLQVLQQRIEQSKEEIEGFKSRIGGASGQLDLLTQEIGTVQTLLDKGYATKSRLFELQRSMSDLEGSKGQYESEIAKTHQNIAETQMTIIDQQKEFESRNSQDLRDTQAQMADLTNKLHAAQDVLDRTVITAPVAGIVNGLKYHTKGGVIAPTTAIMDIVPQDDQLVIEAHVKSTDISIVHSGLDARVIFTAYKMRNTPKVPGKVTLVSADAFADERTAQPNAYYTARIEVDKSFLEKMQKPVELYPGMPADVMIRTGSRSFLNYLFKPITDSMHSAFREE